MVSDRRSPADQPVLVTGAAGFIGFHLAKRLLDDGCPVVGLDSLNDYYDVTLKEARLGQLEGRDGFAFERIDLADDGAMDALFERQTFGAVAHMAAQAGVRYSLENPRAYVASNLQGFVNILEGCRRQNCPHLIYASSSSVYGANRAMPFRVSDRVDHPVSLYAATKKADELMAHTYSHLYQLPTTGLRFFTVYGPWGRPDMAYFLFTKAISEGRPIKVFNQGRMRRDFTYIDDVVEGLVRLLPRPPAPGSDDRAAGASPSGAPYAVFNIGNNQPEKLGRFIEILETAIGKPAIKEMKPMQPGDVEATYADIDPLSEAVGFRPATPIEEGLGRFVAWYRDYYGT